MARRILCLLTLTLSLLLAGVPQADAAEPAGSDPQHIRRSINELSDEALKNLERQLGNASEMQAALLSRAQEAGAHKELTVAYTNATLHALSAKKISDIGRAFILLGLSHSNDLMATMAEAVTSATNKSGYATISIELHEAAIREAAAKMKSDIREETDCDSLAEVGQAVIAAFAQNVAGTLGEADASEVGQAIAAALQRHLEQVRVQDLVSAQQKAPQ